MRKRVPNRLEEVLAIVLFLSGIPAAASSQQADPGQLLRDWAASGQIEEIRKLLTENDSVSVDSRGEGGWTALMIAAEAGQDGIVRLLLDAGANLGLENDRGETALILAAKRGRRAVALSLLEAGADYSAPDGEGRTPLYRAIEHGKAEVIELLQAAAQAASDQNTSDEERTRKGGTTPPKLVISEPAPYPETAKQQGIEGTVVLMVLVRRDGSVGAASVSQGIEESLDRSALRTVKKWKFEPAMRDGKTVEIIIETKIDFKPPTGSL